MRAGFPADRHRRPSVVNTTSTATNAWPALPSNDWMSVVDFHERTRRAVEAAGGTFAIHGRHLRAPAARPTCRTRPRRLRRDGREIWRESYGGDEEETEEEFAEPSVMVARSTVHRFVRSSWAVIGSVEPTRDRRAPEPGHPSAKCRGSHRALPQPGRLRDGRLGPRYRRRQACRPPTLRGSDGGEHQMPMAASRVIRSLAMAMMRGCLAS